MQQRRLGEGVRKFTRELLQMPGVVDIETTTGGNHLKVRLIGGRSVIVSNSASDHRFMRQVQRDVRRRMSEPPNE
jgi:hypothetical protein